MNWHDVKQDDSWRSGNYFDWNRENMHKSEESIPTNKKEKKVGNTHPLLICVIIAS